MTSASSMRMTVERNVVSQSMSLLLRSMSEEARHQLGQWLLGIEEHASKSIAELTNRQTSKRRSEIIATAAIYRTFLEYESRTRLSVGTPFLSEALGISRCSINQAYHGLFDRKVRVLRHKIKCIPMLSEGLADIVVEVVQSIQNALGEVIPRTDESFASVQADAISMVSSLKRKQLTTSDPDAIAAAAVFGAVQRQPTRDVVHVSQKDIP